MPVHAGDGATARAVRIPVNGAGVAGDLVVPARATGLVIFAHGSGSSRHSPRNRAVAAALERAGLATLLLDLLTPDEERLDAASGHFRFDIELLSARLLSAVDWATSSGETQGLPVALFGASTGAAAALVAAAARTATVRAVVSRGGRPDLAGPFLARVCAPVLLIVGGRDSPVIQVNREAAGRLACPHEIAIVPGATHLFEEPGALEEVAALATRWFVDHLAPAAVNGAT